MLAASFQHGQATWRGRPTPAVTASGSSRQLCPRITHLHHPVCCPPFWGQRLSVCSNYAARLLQLGTARGAVPCVWPTVTLSWLQGVGHQDPAIWSATFASDGDPQERGQRPEGGPGASWVRSCVGRGSLWHIHAGSTERPRGPACRSTGLRPRVTKKVLPFEDVSHVVLDVVVAPRGCGSSRFCGWVFLPPDHSAGSDPSSGGLGQW